jgi:hypothetical protein
MGPNWDATFSSLKRRSANQTAWKSIYNMSMEEARWGAHRPDGESSIPMIRAEFPCFTSKSVRFSPNLPLTLSPGNGK